MSRLIFRRNPSWPGQPESRYGKGWKHRQVGSVEHNQAQPDYISVSIRFLLRSSSLW